MICFCKYIIDEATRRNKKIFRFTVMEGPTETYKICGALFRRGNFDLGANPYPEKFNVGDLPDLRNTGDNRGGMLHLAGLCPKHAIEFDDKLLSLMLADDEPSGDSDASGDDSSDPAVSPAASSSSSEATDEMLTQNNAPTPSATVEDEKDHIDQLRSELAKKRAKKSTPTARKKAPQKRAKLTDPPKRASKKIPPRNSTEPHKLPPPSNVARRNTTEEVDDSSYSSNEDHSEALAVTLKKIRPNETVSQILNQSIFSLFNALFNGLFHYIMPYLMNYLII